MKKTYIALKPLRKAKGVTVPAGAEIELEDEKAASILLERGAIKQKKEEPIKSANAIKKTEEKK